MICIANQLIKERFESGVSLHFLLEIKKVQGPYSLAGKRTSFAVMRLLVHIQQGAP